MSSPRSFSEGSAFSEAEETRRRTSNQEVVSPRKTVTFGPASEVWVGGQRHDDVETSADGVQRNQEGAFALSPSSRRKVSFPESEQFPSPRGPRESRTSNSRKKGDSRLTVEIPNGGSRSVGHDDFSKFSAVASAEYAAEEFVSTRSRRRSAHGSDNSTSKSKNPTLLNFYSCSFNSSCGRN